MKYVIGLGNPSEEYKKTRHNIGATILEMLHNQYFFSGWEFDKYLNAYTSNGSINDYEYIFILPQTYMNNSGKTVLQLLKKYSRLEDIIVVYDELAFNLGQIKISHLSSSGGHNGIQSIIDSIKTKEFLRIRLGIKTDVYEKMKEKSADSILALFVLKKFLKIEESLLPKIADKTVEALYLISKEGKEKAMTLVNAL